MTEYTLHEHQEQAIRHFQSNPKAGCFLPMGAGKSLSVLHALTPAHLPALIVAPKQVAENVWTEEPAKWRPDLTVGLAIGTPAKRKEAEALRRDLTVISRDNLGELVDSRNKPRHPYRTIILDESQSFKTKSSARWKAARFLSRAAEHTWIMTGTPAGNGLMDVWAQVYLLDNGKRLGATLGQFRERYFTPKFRLPNGIVAKWEIKEGAEDAIYKKIADICLHIPLIGLDLPELTINTVPVSIPPAAKQLYKGLAKDMAVDLEIVGGVGVMTVPSAGVLSSKLSQITSGHMYGETPDDPEIPIHPAKLDALGEIIEQTEGGVLVFYRFKHEATRILDRFPQAVPVSRSGAVAAWNRREIPVMVAHPASAGHGLNLQHGGNTAVWTSLSWSAEEWLQANARLHRQGQKNRVMVHVLTVPGSIDDQVRKAVEGKVTVQEALLAAIESLW